jgi:hypothetical protein
MRLNALLVALLLFSSIAFASQLKVTSPAEQTLVVGEDVLDLGVIGPGQTVEIIADRGAGEIAKDSQTKGEALWDKLMVVRETLPFGWKAEDSKLYESPFRAFVTTSPTAEDGEYSFQLRAMDQYEGVLEKTFNAKVLVSKDLLETSVSPSSVTTGVGLPAVFQIKLKNKSSASDVFQINATGVPGEWRETRRVFVPFHSEVEVPYEILANEQGEFKLSIRTVSLSSDLISSKQDVTLITQSSLVEDLKALKRGLLLFPTAEQAVYSALGLIAQLVFG